MFKHWSTALALSVISLLVCSFTFQSAPRKRFAGVLASSKMPVGAPADKAEGTTAVSIVPNAPTATSFCLLGQSLAAADPNLLSDRPNTAFNCSNAEPAAAQPNYDAYAFTINGCSGTFSVAVTTCVGPTCGGTTGVSAAGTTRLAIYQKAGGAAGTPASKIFDPASPLTNYRVGDGAPYGGACPAGSGGRFTNVASNDGTCPLSAGDFVVVVMGAATTDTNNYNLLVSTTNCTSIVRVSSPSAANGVVTGRVADDNGNPVEGAVVRLSGTQNRKFIADANGVYRFDNVETNGFYTVTPSRANYTFSPATRSFSQVGESTEAAFGATAATDNYVNPLDTPEYFVRQNYLDFLGREPDEAGFNFWSDQILACGDDADCVDRKRTNVSAAYFHSIEFQETGGLVDGLYRTAYGVRPNFGEFRADAGAVAPTLVVGRDGWQVALENGKAAFIDAFVQRPAFQSVYGGLSNEAYVDALIANTGVTFTSAERGALVSGLGEEMTRAGVLRAIVEDARAAAAKRNEAFVMMEYFGYLRREPDAEGFDYWLNKLVQFNGNFEQAEMVRSFIVSKEYRNRFPR